MSINESTKIGVCVNQLDFNELEELQVSPDSKITKICARNNHLRRIDISSTSLKILYLDSNPKLQIRDFNMLKHLDAFSLEILKDPLGPSELGCLCDVGSLKLIGNGGIREFPIAEPFLNLRKLDLAGLGLESLPEDFGHHAINLRELNLSFNNITDLTPLHGIPKLAQVFLYKNCIDSINECLDFVKNSSYLQLVDLRENPITRGFYPDINTTLREWTQAKETRKEQKFKWYMRSMAKGFQKQWFESDRNHAAELERYDEDRFNKRVGYQGLLVSAGPELKWLDGLILDQERVAYIKKHWAFVISSAKAS